MRITFPIEEEDRQIISDITSNISVSECFDQESSDVALVNTLTINAVLLLSAFSDKQVQATMVDKKSTILDKSYFAWNKSLKIKSPMP